MAFPSISSTATTNGTAESATPVVNLPASIVAGNTLVVVIRVRVDGVIGWPAGWTELLEVFSDASDDRMAWGWRKADGAEGATITLSSGNGKFAAIAWNIAGAADPTVTPPQLSGTLGTGTSTAPDPPSCTPTGGAKDYLWLWTGGWEGEQTSPPASNPTNYTLNVIGANSGTAGAVTTNCRVAGAGRQLNAASEDPGSWTISASDNWMAIAVVVHPAAAVNPQGDLAVTEAPDVLAAAGDVIVAGSLAATDALDVAAFAGDVIIAGSLAAAEAVDAFTAAGTVADAVITGDLAATEAGDTGSASGTVLVAGDVAATDGTDAMAVTGAVLVAGDLAATEAADALAAAGTVTWPAVAGDLATIEAQDAAALAGGVLVAGALAVTEGTSDVAALAGDVIVAGALITTEAPDTLAATGTVAAATITGDMAATETADAAAATGDVIVAGALAVTEAADALAASSDDSPEPDNTSSWAWALPDPPKPISIVEGRATLSAGSRLTAAGVAIPGPVRGAAALKARGALTARGQTIALGDASLESQGRLVARSMVIALGAARLDGGAPLDVVSGPVMPGPAPDDDEVGLLIALGIL